MLAYSRCAWDSTFLFLTVPPVLYTAMLIADRRAKRRDWFVFLSLALLSVWIHVTTSLLLIGIGITLLWLRRSSWRQFAVRVVVLVVAGLAAFLILCRMTRRPAFETLASVFDSALALLAHPRTAVSYLFIVGDILCGARGFRLYAGVEASGVLERTRVIFVVAVIYMVVALARARRTRESAPSAADRFVVVLWALVPLLLIAAVGRTALNLMGSERYVLWLLPMLTILTVRYLATTHLRAAPAVIVTICTIFLIQFWTYYFFPLIHLTHQDVLEPTFWTAPIEPKAQAAEIVEQMDPSGGRRVFADIWWFEHPMRFLLYGRNPVLRADAPIVHDDIARGFFIVAIADQDFARTAIARLEAAKKAYQRKDVMGGNGKPVLTVLYVLPEENR